MHVKFISQKGTIVIEVQYLMNTLKDLTFDKYIMSINYWSLTSLVYFFNQLEQRFLDQKIDTHGGSIRVYIKKDKKLKLNKALKKCLKEEVFGIKDFKTYQKFDKVYKIRENVIKISKNSKKKINLLSVMELQQKQPRH